jgi:menaquinone-dependent protoporphyrinogen oxidase
MARILVLHSSIDGHTRRIAQRIGAVLASEGHIATLRSADAPAVGSEVERCDGVIVGAAIRYGHYAPYLEGVVRDHREAIEARPNAFFSVCLTAGGPGARPKAARRYVDDLMANTGWRPGATAIFAGALQYRRYNPFTRAIIRLIMTITGGDTDTSRNYEYTDWQAVDRFAEDFVALLPAQASRLAAAA